MGLPDDLRSLKGRTLAQLLSAHEYYVHTKVAWKLVGDVIRAGRKFLIRNATTNTVTNQAELEELARGYVATQLAEATFQQFVSIFENFYVEFLTLWLTAYPESLGRKTLEFRTVLELPDRGAVTQFVVGKELNEVLYGRPTGWFAYLDEKVKLGCPDAGEIGRIAEIKASRDVLAHNQGIANKVYESKAGNLARFREGERVEIPEPYHRETWELIRKVVSDISDAGIAKAS